MKVNSAVVSFPKSTRMTLFVFGDMQWGTAGFNEQMWKYFENDFKSTKNAYALGLGDYDDFVRWTVRKGLIAATAGDRSIRKRMDDLVVRGVNELSEKLAFMKGKVIGLHSGHHEWEFDSGITSTQMLCHDLKCPHLEWTAYTVLKIKENNGKGRAVKIWSTHGEGGSAFSSSDMANLERRIAPYWNADIYLRGHSSKLEMTPMELNDVTVHDAPVWFKRTRWVVNCGGFMEGYTEGEAGYVERKSMPPASLGYVKVEIWVSSAMPTFEKGKKITGILIQPYLVSPRMIS